MGVKILLADDHHVVREGIRELLNSQIDMEVIAEVADGADAVKEAERLRPDILLADISMPGFNGLEVARVVSERSPETKVVILSMHSDERYVLQALRNGARGYLVKDARGQELLHAIREVASGRRFLSSTASQKAIEAFLETGQQGEPEPYETLTSREREVLQLAAEGRGNPEIAARLSISPRTVEIHRASMMRKLSLTSRADLALYAAWKGLIPLHPREPRSEKS